MSKTTCGACPHHCNLSEGRLGLCHSRMNKNGSIVPVNYGLLTAMALDPVEKKPLRHFYPGASILSVGSFGCNLRCPFCQNHEISMVSGDRAKTSFVPPEELIKTAMDLIPKNNIGIAFTYNEPLIGYEYVRDCAMLAKSRDLKSVLVTNGCFTLETLEEVSPYIDAMNIDLKGFTGDFYSNIGGDLDTVKEFIIHAYKSCHIEITTLIIPDENDSEKEIRQLSRFISAIHPDIPLHLSRYFPRYKMTGTPPTDVGKIYKLADIARESLNYVYGGNI